MLRPLSAMSRSCAVRDQVGAFPGLGLNLQAAHVGLDRHRLSHVAHLEDEVADVDARRRPAEITLLFAVFLNPDSSTLTV